MTFPVIYEWPEHLLRASTNVLTLQRIRLTSRSPFSGFQRMSLPIDERWLMEMTAPPMSSETFEEWEAFILRLDGAGGYCRAWDPAREIPLGDAAGSFASAEVPHSDGALFSDGRGYVSRNTRIYVQAAAPAGQAWVTVSGLLASRQNALTAGTRIEIGGLLYRIVTTAASSAAGHATLEIRPRLRMALPVGQPINLYRPSSVFRLADDGTGAVTRSMNVIGEAGLKLIEVPEVMIYQAATWPI